MTTPTASDRVAHQGSIKLLNSVTQRWPTATAALLASAAIRFNRIKDS